MTAGGIGVDAAARGAGDIPEIGVGMLGYAFMGKAHANGYKTLAYMAWPPPLRPRLVSIAGRDEAAVAEAARRYGFERLRHRLARARRGPGRPALRQRRAEQPPRRADDRGSGGGEARVLREAARTDRGRELRDLAARRRDRREAHDRVQLPLRPGCSARAPDARGGRARRDPPLPRQVSAGVGLDDRRRLAVPQGRGGLGRARRPRRARDRPRALPRRRDLVGLGFAADVHGGAGGRRRVRGGRRVRRTGARDDRGDALRGRPEERVQLGDQRHQGLARVRPRAAQRAPALAGDDAVSARSWSARPTTRSGSGGGRTGT